MMIMGSTKRHNGFQELSNRNGTYYTRRNEVIVFCSWVESRRASYHGGGVLYTHFCSKFHRQGILVMRSQGREEETREHLTKEEW